MDSKCRTGCLGQGTIPIQYTANKFKGNSEIIENAGNKSCSKSHYPDHALHTIHILYFIDTMQHKNLS